MSVRKVCIMILIDPCFSNAQENAFLMEGGWRELDEAAVSAEKARHLHCANCLHPLIPAGDHITIPAALRGSKRDLVPLGKCSEDQRPGNEDQWPGILQALLHQLMGSLTTPRSQ
jgi:hypothetical protein